MSHLPSDDEARSLYLGLKRRAYDNKTRVHLSSNIENVELPTDIREQHVPEHVMAAYRDLFRTPVQIMLDTPVFPADALPAFQPQCPHQVSCPPWQDAVIERLPMWHDVTHDCGCYERWDEIDAADCETAQQRYAYMLRKCNEHAVVDDPQG